MENAWSKRGNREIPKEAVAFHSPGQRGQGLGFTLSEDVSGSGGGVD